MLTVKNVLTYVVKRNLTVTACLENKKNFRKFVLANKRGTRIFKKRQAVDPDPEIPFYSRGLKNTGFKLNGRFVNIPEMCPELIVPDLKGCSLKPYVSYRTPDVSQPEFTAEDLFNAIYEPKITSDFKKGKLDADGNPKEPSAEENLSAEEAFIKARKTGSDLI